MGRVHFRTGRVAPVIDYTRKFPADREGTCFLCERPSLPGDLMKWAQKTYKQDQGRKRTQWLPVHTDCNDWKYKARNNPRTTDGGYDVAPSTPTRSERNATMRSNRSIDRAAGLAIPPMPGGEVITSTGKDRVNQYRSRTPNRAAQRLIEIEKFRQAHFT